jgi:hypothetical protein
MLVLAVLAGVADGTVRLRHKLRGEIPACFNRLNDLAGAPLALKNIGEKGCFLKLLCVVAISEGDTCNVPQMMRQPIDCD